MVQVFVRKVQDFAPDFWRVVAFGGSKSFYIKDLIERSNPDDLVVSIGSKGTKTSRKEKGKLLGMMTFERNLLKEEEIRNLLDNSLLEVGKALHLDGSLRWPHAVEVSQAWKFAGDVFSDTLHRTLSQHNPRDPSALLLDKKERDFILSLKCEEVHLGPPSLPDQESKQNQNRGPTRGPVPSQKEKTITIVRKAIQVASTYALRFGKKDIWKIGYSKNPWQRCRECGKHVPHEVLRGENWELFQSENWKNELKAYEMEQKVLKILSRARTEGERVRCTEIELQKAWKKAIKVVRTS